jgi:hypothetical protein
MLWVCVTGGNLMAATTGMFDPTGMPLVERLITGSGIDLGDIDADRVEYVGLIENGQAQAGLFDQLVLRGQNYTSLTLDAGIVLTTGLITGLPASNTSGWYSNITNTGGNNYFRDFPAQTGSSRHGGRLDERDENSVQFELDAPNDVQGLTLEFVYASEEFPEWSGTQFADGFVFMVNDVNYAKLPDGRPVSLLRQEDNIHFLTNGDSFAPGIPAVADVEYDGLTRVLQLTAPLVAGNRNSITIAVGDTGDEIYDSAAFLSRIRLLTGTSPLPDTDVGVKVRHKSEDDLFDEPEVETPELGDFNADGSVDAADYVVWRDKLGTLFTQFDYGMWRDHFGQTAASTGAIAGNATSSIPEPASLGLALVALCMGLARSGRRHRQPELFTIV